MSRTSSLLAGALLALAGCHVEPAPEPTSTLYLQGGVLATDPASRLLSGNEQLRPLAPGGAESLWTYELDEGSIRPVEVADVWLDGDAVTLTEVARNHVGLAAGAARDIAWLHLTVADGRSIDQLIRVVPVAAAMAAPAGMWTEGDPELHAGNFAVWSGGVVAVALLGQRDAPDFRVVDHGLVAVSPELLPTSRWDAFSIDAPAGRHTFQVRSGRSLLGFDVDVVDAIDRLEVIEDRAVRPPLGEPAPHRVCFRARAGDAIVTGALIDFTVAGDAELVRSPTIPASCAEVQLRRGSAVVQASLGGLSTRVWISAP